MPITRKTFLRSVSRAAIAGAAAGWASPVPLLAGVRPSRGASAPSLITSLEVAPLHLPQKEPVKIALATPVAAESVIVRLRTAEGTTGLGEGSPYSPITSETQASDLALARLLRTAVCGRDPFALPQIVAGMDALAPEAPAIKAAIEMAVWDICGKMAGLPVYRLLGQFRDWFETDQTVYLDPPAITVKKAIAIAQAGFRHIKMKLGEGPEKDIERTRMVREALGPNVILRVDANQGWSVPEAIRTLRGIEQYSVEFCEQPVHRDDLAGLQHVRRSVPIAIMADEAISSPRDAVAALRYDAMDMINIKLMKTGGILRAVQLAHVAEAANLPCMVGCMSESRLALTAAAHLVMSQPAIRYADLDTFLEHQIDPVRGGMTVTGGVVRLPDTPGLGLDLDPAVLQTLKPITD